MEIQPCVPQDIGPLGPLPCSHSTSSAITTSRASGTADQVRSLDDLLSVSVLEWGLGVALGVDIVTALGVDIVTPRHLFQVTHPFSRCCFPSLSFRGFVSDHLDNPSRFSD